jgi:glycosyltransferase involved in cell wall biosynthesis
MSVKVATNWADEGLVKALRRRGVRIVPIRGMSLRADFENFDLVYYASPSPPLVNKDVLIALRRLRNVIYGLHMPLTIDNPIKPSHALYNLVTPLQTFVASLKGATLHALNLDDYRFLRAFGLRTVYIPLGTDMELFKCNINKPSTFTVIYASRPSWHKGTDLLVNYIIPILLKALGQGVRIVVTEATSDYLSHIYEKIKGLRRIELHEHLPAGEYARLLSEAHVLLFPSRYESFGRVVLDALAAGVIPVAFNVRGFVRDVLLRTRLGHYVVDYPDLTGFAQRVLKLFRLWHKRPDEYEALSTLACNIAGQYSWDKIDKLWAEEFKRIVFRGRP